eukprot:SAG31_NODE_5405_length_2556_cov_1.432234_3_plen_103_part_00
MLRPFDFVCHFTKGDLGFVLWWAGFTVSGVVLDMKTLKTAAIGIASGVSTFATTLLAMSNDEDAATITCQPTEQQIKIMKALFDNATCAYNVTIQDILQGST